MTRDYEREEENNGWKEVQCNAFVCIAGDTDWNSIVRWHYRTHRLYSQRKEYESTWLGQKNGQKRSGRLKVDDRIPEFDSPLYCRTVNGIGRVVDPSDEIIIVGIKNNTYICLDNKSMIDNARII